LDDGTLITLAGFSPFARKYIINKIINFKKKNFILYQLGLFLCRSLFDAKAGKSLQTDNIIVAFV